MPTTVHFVRGRVQKSAIARLNDNLYYRNQITRQDDKTTVISDDVVADGQSTRTDSLNALQELLILTLLMSYRPDKEQ